MQQILARKIDKNKYPEVLDICKKSNVKLVDMPIESFKWEKNYEVSLISSRQFGNAENIHAFPEFMNRNSLNESEK